MPNSRLDWKGLERFDGIDGPQPISAEEEPHWPARYGLWALIASFGTMVVGSIFVLGPFFAPLIQATGSGDLDTNPVALLLGSLTADSIFVLTAIGFASAADQMRLKLFGVRKLAPAKTGKWVALAICIYLPIFFAIQALGTDTDSETRLHLSVLGIIAMFIALSILTPIGEEFLFRGFIYQSFRTRMPFLLAALLSSALFGLGHVQGFNIDEGLIPFAWTMVFGMTLCFVLAKTRSLIPGMIVHALHNGAVVVLVAIV